MSSTMLVLSWALKDYCNVDEHRRQETEFQEQIGTEQKIIKNNEASEKDQQNLTRLST